MRVRSGLLSFSMPASSDARARAMRDQGLAGRDGTTGSRRPQVRWGGPRGTGTAPVISRQQEGMPGDMTRGACRAVVKGVA